MKRRKFFQNLLVAPVLPAVAAAAQQTAAPQHTTTPQQQPPPQANTPAHQLSHQPGTPPKLAVIQADLASLPDQHFFDTGQFAALEKLGSLLMPPLKGNPGALDAGAPEFLDFLLSVSPGDRQQLYRHGLDGLNSQARERFQKPFSDLANEQADSIIGPLLVARPWPEDLPSDPMQNFMAQVHEDLRTATVNSREWAKSSAASGRRPSRFNRTVGYYWKPIDPVVKD